MGGEHVSQDGGVLDVDISSHVIQYRGRPARVAILSDISQRKRSENNLRLSNERLTLLASIASIVIGSLDFQDQMRETAEQVRQAFQVDTCVIRRLEGGEL